jgi:hydrogenase nickel incorporation protein HypA/HybF
MHELPVVIDLVRIAGEESAKRSMKKVSRINLVIGELSAIIDESVQMYFEVIAENTCCAGAELCFEHCPAILKCCQCGHNFPHVKSFDCPECGGDSVLIKGTGREFYVRSIEGE